MVKDTSEVLNDLFSAVDKIVDVRIQNLNFNKTLLCEIVDDFNKSIGKYVVTDGVTRFDAYSENHDYNKKDTVYVLIPNGDFDAQKTILRKQVKEEDLSKTYISPLKSFIKGTKNYIEEFRLDDGPAFGQYSTDMNLKIVANTIPDSKITLSKNHFTWGGKEDTIPIVGSEMLGLSGDFISNFKIYENNNNEEYEEDNPYIEPIEGNYGLLLLVYEKYDDIEPCCNPIQLDSNIMYGNIYNYNFATRQEGCFDIKQIKQIGRMELYLYQNNNFKDDKNELMRFELAGYNNTSKPNVTVSNLQMYFGKNTQKMKEGELTLFSSTPQNYSEQDENPRASLSASLYLSEDKIIDTGEEFQELENSRILWYHYNQNAFDKWEVIKESNTSLACDSIILSQNKKLEQFKAIIEVPSKNYLEECDKIVKDISNSLKDIENNSEDAHYWILKVEQDRIDFKKKYNLDILHDELTRENNAMIQSLYTITKSQEDIIDSISIRDYLNNKDILITLFKLWTNAYEELKEKYENDAKVEQKTYQSAIFTYTNISKVTNVTENNQDINLLIDSEYYNGIYFLYDLKNQISVSADATRKRKMIAELSPRLLEKEDLSVSWYIPVETENTMIRYVFNRDKAEKVRFIKVQDNIHFFESDINGNYYKVNDYEAWFTISETYNMNWINNSVYFQVETIDGEIIEISSQLSFGPKGSQGTEYTFIFEPEIKRPLLATGDEMILYPRLLDSLGKEIIIDEEITYSFYGENSLQNNSIKVILDEENAIANSCKVVITENENPNWEELRYKILEAVITKRINNDKIIKMTAYYPLDITTQKGEILYYGVNTIEYNDMGGSPEYYRDEHTLWVDNNKLKNLSWKIQREETTIGDKTDNQFYPIFNQKNMLIVPAMYLNGISTEIAVEAFDDNNLIYSHPLRIYQNAYEFELLNSWDENLTIDEKNGTILSSVIGAGKKENDNSFSGVMMGQINSNSNGLFGYHNGAQSFGFKSDGTAFLGKSGKGQILFDGNEGIIQSAGFDLQGSQSGMMLNLETGKFISQSALNNKNSRSLILINPNPNPDKKSEDAYFFIQSEEGKKLLYINRDGYYLQSAQYPSEAISYTQISYKDYYKLVDKKITNTNIVVDVTNESYQGIINGMNITGSVNEVITSTDINEDNDKDVGTNNTESSETQSTTLQGLSGIKITLKYKINNEIKGEISWIGLKNNDYNLRLPVKNDNKNIGILTYTDGNVTFEAEDGFIYTSTAKDTNNLTGTRIDLNTGSLISYNMNLQGFYKSNLGQFIQLNSIDQNTPLKIVKNGKSIFAVSWEGALISQKAIFDNVIAGSLESMGILKSQDIQNNSKIITEELEIKSILNTKSLVSNGGIVKFNKMENNNNYFESNLDSYFNGTVRMNNGVDIYGTTNINQTLNIKGACTITNNINLNGPIWIGGKRFVVSKFRYGSRDGKFYTCWSLFYAEPNSEGKWVKYNSNDSSDYSFQVTRSK